MRRVQLSLTADTVRSCHFVVYRGSMKSLVSIRKCNFSEKKTTVYNNGGVCASFYCVFGSFFGIHWTVHPYKALQSIKSLLNLRCSSQIASLIQLCECLMDLYYNNGRICAVDFIQCSLCDLNFVCARKVESSPPNQKAKINENISELRNEQYSEQQS